MTTSDAGTETRDMQSPAAADHADELILRAIELGGFGVALLDGEARLLRTNAPARRLLQRSETQLAGTPVAELVSPDDRGWLGSELELLMAGAIGRFRHVIRLAGDGNDETRCEVDIRALSGHRSARAVALLEDASDPTVRDNELRGLADADPLTDLLNRRRFVGELERHLAHAARYGTRGALLLLDVDRLRVVNDAHGHVAGDRAVIGIAQLIRSRTRASDVVARLGGDEFAVLLPHATADEAAMLAAVLVKSISAEQQTVEDAITVSIGIASLSGATNATETFERADRAMYEVKRAGGNGYGIDRDQADEAPAAPASGSSPDVSDADTTTELELGTLLQTVSEFGSASPGLIAWELDLEADTVGAPWSVALRDQLIERARYDSDDREWQYRLTKAGRARLRSLELAARRD